MSRGAALASLVLLAAGVVRAEGGEAPLVLDGGTLVERWARPAPAGDVHYAVSGWYDLLLAHGARLEVVDRATGHTRASFDVGCEVRGLGGSELVLCDDEVRWIEDLRLGRIVPLRGLPRDVRQADSRGEMAAVVAGESAFLLQLPPKLVGEEASGEVAPFELAVPFAPERVSFAGYDVVVVTGRQGELTFFESRSGAPLDEPARFLDEVRAYTLVDAHGRRPARVDGAVAEAAFLSDVVWQEGGALLRVRHAIAHDAALATLAIVNASELSGTLLYVVERERVRAFSRSLLRPSGYEPKTAPVLGVDAQALALFAAAGVGVAAAPALLFALQPDLGSAAIGTGLLAVFGAVPMALGIAAVGTAMHLVAVLFAPRAGSSGCGPLDDVVRPAADCLAGVIGAAGTTLLVLGAGLVLLAPVVFSSMLVADPGLASGSLDPVLLTSATTAAAAVGAAAALGVAWLVPLPDDGGQEVAVVLGRLAFGAAVAGAAGAAAYGTARALTR